MSFAMILMLGLFQRNALLDLSSGCSNAPNKLLLTAIFCRDIDVAFLSAERAARSAVRGASGPGRGHFQESCPQQPGTGQPPSGTCSSLIEQSECQTDLGDVKYVSLYKYRVYYIQVYTSQWALFT